MTDNPGDVIKRLTREDNSLLNEILNLEKCHLHKQDIKKNSREEKEIVEEIFSIINRAVKDED